MRYSFFAIFILTQIVGSAGVALYLRHKFNDSHYLLRITSATLVVPLSTVFLFYIYMLLIVAKDEAAGIGFLFPIIVLAAIGSLPFTVLTAFLLGKNHNRRL